MLPFHDALMGSALRKRLKEKERAGLTLSAR
jgi:hypothetical protein